MVDDRVLEIVLSTGFILYTLAMIMYSYRVFKGPSVADTVIALDALTVDLIILFLLITIYYGNQYLAIAVIPLAAWVFILDVVVAKYLVRKGGGGSE